MKKVNGKLKSLKVNKNVNKKFNSKDNEGKNIIIAYSMIEQGKNNIMGIGKILFTYIGIFPFIPLLLSLFSCYINKLSNNVYSISFFCMAIFGVIIMFGYMAVWLKNVMTVFIIDEKYNLYRVRISVFWYKIKDKMYLLNPNGVAGGRLIRMFYMINNIKLVLESAMKDITFDEFISMGRMENLSDIKNVRITNKRIAFNAAINSKSGRKDKRIRILNAFEQSDKFCEYLKKCAEGGTAAAKEIVFDGKINVEDLLLKKMNISPLTKLRRFTIKWTSIAAWIAAITLSGDLSRLSRINAGEYVLKNAKEVSAYYEDKEDNTGNEKIYVNVNDEKDYFKKSEYGTLYKPILILYVSPLLVYALMVITDKVIDSIKSRQE